MMFQAALFVWQLFIPRKQENSFNLLTQVHHLRKERLFYLHHNSDSTSFFPLFFQQIQKPRRWQVYLEMKGLISLEIPELTIVVVNNLTKQNV